MRARGLYLFCSLLYPQQLAQYLELSVSHSVMSSSFDSINYSPPGSSVHGILQARILGWVAISFSRGSSQPREWTRVPCIAGRFFTLWATRGYGAGTGLAVVDNYTPYTPTSSDESFSCSTNSPVHGISYLSHLSYSGGCVIASHMVFCLFIQAVLLRYVP